MSNSHAESALPFRVSRCVAGCIHLEWGPIMVSLPPDDFFDFASRIRSVETQLRASQSSEKGHEWEQRLTM